MMAGHSLQQAAINPVCTMTWKIKSTDPSTEGVSRAFTSHAHQYTMFKDKSLRNGACKCQALSGSGNADVWRKDKCDGG